MNKPSAGTPVLAPPRLSSPERSAAGRLTATPAPGRKPIGPVIYRVEKGADVWPGRK